ncbi:glycosyltransferase family 4 protein, partial [Escherichia coli]|nr:glycosyltransferase family 4 protein [Escherichia coli]
IYITTSRTTFGFLRDAYIILLGKMFGAKIINHLHGSDFISFRASKRSLFRCGIDFVYNLIDHSIVLLPRMVEQYAIYNKMKVSVVTNCYSGPVSTFYKQERLKGLKILYLSNVMYSKGVFHLIRAVKSLVKEGYDLSLVIAGEILSDEFLNQQAAEKIFFDRIKKSDFISYVGTVSGEAKKEVLIDADVFILPTFYRSEAQPISIIEAMLYGCLIITSRHKYLEDMISEDNGLLITKKSAYAIKEAIKVVYSATDLVEKSNLNRKLALDKYKPEIYIGKITEIIKGE